MARRISSKSKSNLKPRPLKTQIRALGDMSIKDLTGDLLETFSERDIRRAYTELRRAALTRVERAVKAGIMSDKKGGYLKSRLPTLSEIDAKALTAQKPEYVQPFKKNLLNIALMESKHILLKDSTTKSGYESRREKTLETLRLKGGAYTYINEDNIDEFGMYMDALREKYDLERGSRGSEQAVMLFKAYKQNGIAGEDIIRDFKLWQSQRKVLEKEAKTKAGKFKKIGQLKKIAENRQKKQSRRAKKKNKRKK